MTARVNEIEAPSGNTANVMGGSLLCLVALGLGVYILQRVHAPDWVALSVIAGWSWGCLSAVRKL